MNLTKTLTWLPVTAQGSTFKYKLNLHKYTAKKAIRHKSQAKQTTLPFKIVKNSVANHKRLFIINTENPKTKGFKLIKTPILLPKIIPPKPTSNSSHKHSMSRIMKREISKNINFPNVTIDKMTNQIYTMTPHNNPKKRNINSPTYRVMTAAIISRSSNPTKKNSAQPNPVHNWKKPSFSWFKITRTSSKNSEWKNLN